MFNREINFPDFFPEGCPPKEAITEFCNLNVYRWTSQEAINKSCFLSYYELGKCNNIKNLSSFAISTFQDLNVIRKQVIKLQQASPAFKNQSLQILKGQIVEGSGAIKENFKTSHVDWWLKKDFDPSEYFNFI